MLKNAEIAALEEQEAKIMAEGFVQNVYNRYLLYGSNNVANGARQRGLRG